MGVQFIEIIKKEFQNSQNNNNNKSNYHQEYTQSNQHQYNHSKVNVNNPLQSNNNSILYIFFVATTILSVLYILNKIKKKRKYNQKNKMITSYKKNEFEKENKEKKKWKEAKNKTINFVNNQDKLICVVCLENQKQILFNSCKHVCVCEQCLIEIIHANNKCPICKRKKNNFLLIKV